jgi:type II secretory pathway component PulF
MPQFSYKGFDSSGSRVAGSLVADDAERALHELRERGYLISAISPVDSGEDWRSVLGFGSPKVELADLEFLTAELSLLLDSGVRIDKALSILMRSASRPAVRRLLVAITAELKQGKQLSESLAAQSEIFNPLYVNLVAIGETGGRLPEIFRGLASDLRFQRELRQKVVAAATYPIVVAAVSVLAVLFIFNFVVPNMESLFSGSENLPWYTSMLLNSSAFMQKWQGLVFVACGLVGLIVWRKRRSAGVLAAWEGLSLSLPVLRDAVVMVDRIRFSSGLALMLQSGIAVDRALVLATQNIQNRALRAEVATAVSRVTRGELLSATLRQTRLFSDYFASLVEVGEESGQLGRVFGEVADRSRDAFARVTLRFTTLLEPLLILLMGLIVGGVVVVMMLSITSVTDVGL